MSESVIAKYVDGPAHISGEGIPPIEIKARKGAIEDNPDGTVTVHLLTERVSTSVNSKLSSPYGNIGDVFTNIAVKPDGDWDLKLVLPSREEAESLVGPVEVGKEVIRYIRDMHAMLLVVHNEEKTSGVKTPDTNVKFNR